MLEDDFFIFLFSQNAQRPMNLVFVGDWECDCGEFFAVPFFAFFQIFLVFKFQFEHTMKISLHTHTHERTYFKTTVHLETKLSQDVNTKNKKTDNIKSKKNPMSPSETGSLTCLLSTPFWRRPAAIQSEFFHLVETVLVLQKSNL